MGYLCIKATIYYELIYHWVEKIWKEIINTDKETHTRAHTRIRTNTEMYL